MKLPIAKLNCVGAEENFFFLLIHSRNLITAPLASDDDVELFSFIFGLFLVRLKCQRKTSTRLSSFLHTNRDGRLFAEKMSVIDDD